MAILQNRVWLGCLFLLGLHQMTQKILAYKLALFDNYLDTFLSMPILLGLILQERQFLITRFFRPNQQTNYQFSILEIIIATTFFAIIFEEGFPKWSPYFTKDYWDYLAYFSGALVFYFFINRPYSKKLRPPKSLRLGRSLLTKKFRISTNKQQLNAIYETINHFTFSFINGKFPRRPSPTQHHLHAIR